MTRVTFRISVSLDGYVAGPNAGREHPLGEGGDRLHRWANGLPTWLEMHGREGGERNADAVSSRSPSPPRAPTSWGGGCSAARAALGR